MRVQSVDKRKRKSPVVAATGDFFVLIFKSLLTGCYRFHLLSSQVLMMWITTPVTTVNTASSGIDITNTSLYCQILCGSTVQYSIVPFKSLSNFVDGLKKFLYILVFYVNCFKFNMLIMQKYC